MPCGLSKEKKKSDFASSALQPGSYLLARYKIIEILEENSFGFIYLVERENKNKKYIIKELFPHAYVTRNGKGEMLLNKPLDIESLQRFNYMQRFFIGEANHLEKISIKSHKNIIKIVSVEKNRNNTSYIIYPYEKGMTFHRFMEIKVRMGKGKLNREEIDTILKPLLDAVEHLHTLNLYHLNIKPENIFIKKDGSILLCGFEASIFFHDEDNHLFCNAYTPYYAAPEQVEKKISDIGKQSDIYAIGVLLYKLVTGKYPPSAKERIDCKQKEIAYDPYTSLQYKKRFLQQYDLSFLWVIDKALYFSPRERFRDIPALRKALYPASANKKNKILKNKRNLFLYTVLAIIGMYVLYLGINYFGRDNEVGMIVDTEEKFKIEENQGIPNENQSETKADKRVFNEERNISKITVFEEGNEIESTTDQAKVAKVIVDTEEKFKIEENQSIPNENQSEIKADKSAFNEERNISKTSDEKNETVYGVEIMSIDENISKSLQTPKKDGVASNLQREEEPGQDKVDTAMVKTDGRSLDKSKSRRSLKAKEINKNLQKTLNKRKKKEVKKSRAKIKRKRDIQKKKLMPKTQATHQWYCKALGGNIRTSAKHFDKARARNMALRACKKRAGVQKHCRVLHCILMR